MAKDSTVRRVTVSNDDGDVYVETSGASSEIVLKSAKVRVDGDVHCYDGDVGISQRVDGLTGRVDALNATDGELKTKDTELTGRIDDLNATDATMKSVDAGLANRLDLLNATDDGLVNRLDSLNATDDGLKSRLDVLNATNTELKTKDTELTGRIDDLNATASALTPPKCMPPGGDKLRFDGTNWLCVCVENWSGTTCETTSPNVRLRSYVTDGRNISDFDTSNVTDMRELFMEQTDFNQDLSRWNTSAVTSMAEMFYNARAFNGAIGSWDVSSVTDMSYMFYDASEFNQDLNDWNVSGVTNFHYMFSSARRFNGDITRWDVRGAERDSSSMNNMFADASAFNRDIRSWEVPSDVNTYGMFRETRFVQSFKCPDDENGPPSACYVTPFSSSVALEQAVDACFEEAFDGSCQCLDKCGEAGLPISSWNTAGLLNMHDLFADREFFNEDLSKWDISQAIRMDDMFRNAKAFNRDISSWVVDSVTDMSNMFNGAISFEQSVSNWTTAGGANTTDMFKGATAFNARFVCDGADDGPPNTCVIGDDCDASAAPANGGVGDCTGSLPSGSTCQPTCDDGYTVSGTSSCSLGTLTAATCLPPSLTDLTLPTLAHWFDFSRLGESPIESLVSSDVNDLKDGATDVEVVGTVKFEPDVQNGLGGVYFDKPPTTSRTIRFRSSLLGRNPEVFVVYRVLSYSDNGVIIGDVGNGYGFGTYRAGDGFVTVARSSGTVMVKVSANYSTWHLAHLYFGESESDGFLQVDSGEKHYFGISGKYVTSTHSRPEIGAFSGDSFDHMVEQYVGEVAYFSGALSEEQRTDVTKALMAKWGLG